MLPSQSKIKLGKRPVAKGFRSPADDFLEMPLDLNTYLIKHPVATFFMRARGTNLHHLGINDGDLLVVDRSGNPKDRSIIVAVCDGELVLRKLYKDRNRLCVDTNNSENFTTWGVVAHVIRSY